MTNNTTSTLEVNPDLEEIRETLMCSICHEMVTLPVHAMCCERAKQMSPACLSCVRRYYELNTHPNQRAFSKKAWGGCGCTVYLKNKQYAQSYYSHTLQLDMMRNLFGPSRCPNEGCNVECRTSAELRRHLNGKVQSSDKNPACQEALTKCDYCGFFGKRRVVNGEHFVTNHSSVYCRLCDRRVAFKDAEYHYNHHVRHLQDFLTEYKRIKTNIRDIQINNVQENVLQDNPVENNNVN